MRSKKQFLFDEETEAKKIYNNGFPDGNIDYGKMYILAKFIRQTFGYGEIRLEKAIIEFCKKQDRNFNPITDAGSIKKWVKSAVKYDLRKIESIYVSQKEIDILKTIESNKDKRILFCTLIFSKALKKGNTKRNKENLKTSENYYIHYSNFLDIIRLSGFTNTSEIDLAKIFHRYSFLFTFYKPEKELIRLQYVDTKPENKIVIYDLNNINDYFNIIFKNTKLTHREILAKCIICDKYFIKNSNRQKVCPEDTIILERARKAKWREKQKQKEKREDV